MDLSHEFVFHAMKCDQHLHRYSNQLLRALIKGIADEAFPRASLAARGNGYLADIKIVTLCESLRVRAFDADPYLAIRKAIRILRHRFVTAATRIKHRHGPLAA